MKPFRTILCAFLTIALLVSMAPVYAMGSDETAAEERGIHNTVYIDDDPAGGYVGDYVVIYNPSTSASTSYSTGTMTDLIQTEINANVNLSMERSPKDEACPYKIDVDPMLAEIARNDVIEEPIATRASYSVGSTKTFNIYSTYSPTGSGSVEFKCLYVGQHCYIWTPSSSDNDAYPLDVIDGSYAKMAADEFDSKFDLMQSSFGNHTNGSSGDGKLHILYYNINDGWQPGQGYVAGFFYQVDISNNGLPILNIDTYPGVYYKNSNGNEYKRMDDTYNTMVHEYQHLINYSNTSGMNTWLNECFSAAAEEICYPGSSVVSRIQSWENYYYSGNTWLNPPAEIQYQSGYNLHNGYSMYSWNNNLSDILALYSQVSFFAQYLYSRFDNSIYRQISQKWSYGNEVGAITQATDVDCSELVRDFRVALTANAPQTVANGIYGFKVQDGYDPSTYNNVQNPWSLLAPIVFTGSSCSIKGGGSITVKPVNKVYNPPADASPDLQYIGISLTEPYTVTAVSNNTSWGTVSVNGNVITAAPKNGYYAAGYTVTSGTATVQQEINTFVVTPATNCTVRINFAQAPTRTVNFVACGQNVGSQSAYLYNEITLPASVNVNPTGWTFTGWVAQQISDETTEEPVFLAPGASYQVTANATLYALYTRQEEGGAFYYQLVSEAPADWSGNYAITYGTDEGMYLMKGVAGTDAGTDIESTANCDSYSAAGVSLENGILYNVGDAYRFRLAPHGNYYSVQSISTNTYIGVNASSFLAAFNTYTAESCDWTPGVGGNASSMKSAKNGQYPYLGFSNSGYFWTNSSANTSIRLWKESNGYTTYYCTSPVTAAAPVITTQPKSQTVAYGNTVTFTVAATGSNLRYQWQYKKVGMSNWADWTGKTESSVSFKPYNSNNGCQYRCVVSNEAGSVTSAVATLTVLSKPTITTQPKSQAVAYGNTVTFTVAASGSNLRYQWQYKKVGMSNWADWTGKTESSVSFKPYNSNNGCQYRCVVSNEAGSVTSGVATLTVLSKPTITTQPESQTVTSGNTVTFTVAATGSNLRYQWQYKKVGMSDWADWTGKTESSVSFKPYNSNNGCQYRCVVSNEAGSVTSGVATLTVLSKPVITTQPKSQTVAYGNTVTFTVAATGSNLRYQWQYKKVGMSDWADWTGKTGSSVSFKPATSSHGCQYRCVISNEAGTVTSNAATLTVSSGANALIRQLA